jgi:hypothetical protein
MGWPYFRNLPQAQFPVSGLKLAETLRIEPTKVNRILKTLAWLVLHIEPLKVTIVPGQQCMF